VRRGTTNANIHSLQFDNQIHPEFLACTSDRESIHLFVVETGQSDSKEKKANAQGNIFTKMIGNSEQRSFAQFSMKDKN